MPTEQFKVLCVNCGAELNEQTGYLASPDWYEDTRYVHYCRDCQQKQFEDFAENTSPAFAYFLCCAAYNIPFIPEAMPGDSYDVDEITWHMYLENLDSLGYRFREDDEPAAFCDGITDLIAKASIQHKLYHTTLCNHLLTWARRAETAEELDGITYSADNLPEDLATNMVQVLAAATAMSA